MDWCWTLMRSLIAVAIFLAGLTPAQGRASTCEKQAFGALKHIDFPFEPKSALDLPNGFGRPLHGVIATDQGLFINEGRSAWWIADIDQGKLTNVTWLSAERANRAPRSGQIFLSPDGSMLVIRTLVLSDQQMTDLVCRSNQLWSYQTPSQQQQDEFERKSRMEQRGFDRWLRAAKRCRRHSKCVLPPPPILSLPPPFEPSFDNPLFSEATDVYESISLVDGKEARKDVGGLGVLQGIAAELTEWFRSQIDGSP